MVKKIIVSLIAGILGFLLLGWGYNVLIGKPITLKHYFFDHHISYMKIGLTNNNGETVKTKELTSQELEDFIEQFGPYKIFKPFFRKTMIAKQSKYYIGISLRDSSRKFEVMFPLTDTGEINLVRYTFYPYQTTHINMFNYLFDLLYLE
jgi:hypothetical protein